MSIFRQRYMHIYVAESGVQSIVTSMQTIPDFLEGKTILVTGGSGFIGKALLEKLLRTCPKIRAIYVLVRDKRGKSAQERLEDIIKNEVYSILKQKYPEALQKLVPVLGDIRKLRLGLSSEDEELITSTVDIIYHCAASVRFDDALQEAVITNVRSTREMCYLALKCQRLKAYMHISTTYCNVDIDNVEETIYEPSMQWQAIIRLAEENDATLQAVTNKCMHPFPNSYTFTKRLAEIAANELLKDKVPLVILRPSIVISAMLEPIPGWIGNLNGPFALVTAFMKGITDIGYSNKRTLLDGVFVDNLSKALIMATWKKCRSEDPLALDVYNVSTDIQWPMWCFIKVSTHAFWNYPHVDRLWVYDKMKITESKRIFYLSIIFRFVLFGLIIDTLLRIVGKKPRLYDVLKKVYVGNLSIEYFMNRTFFFENKKYKQLENELCENDKEDFKYYKLPGKGVGEEALYDITKVSILGVKRFIFREPYPIKEETYRNTKWLYALHVANRIVFLAIILYLLFWRYNIVTSTSRKITNYFEAL